jgi:hypothetical protein
MHWLSVINNFLQIDRPDICLDENINIDTLHKCTRNHHATQYFQVRQYIATGSKHLEQLWEHSWHTYATLYFAIHEIQTIPQFHQIIFYRRYVDDCLIIWVPTSTNPIEDHKSYNSFISLMNKFGTLKWNAESRKLSTTFLDLTISINLHTRSIDTTLFENQWILIFTYHHTAHTPRDHLRYDSTNTTIPPH